MEKIEYLIALHETKQNETLESAFYCLNLCLNIAVSGNDELINKLDNGR